MITVIGKDNSRNNMETDKIDMKCNFCGTVFNAALDDFTLCCNDYDEYKLRINCPDCNVPIFFNVEEAR